MYEDCLDVFNSMSYSKHVLDARKASFDENYTSIKGHLNSWKGYMQVKYGNSDMNSEFSKKMQAFMNHLLFLYDSLSPEGQGRADIGYRSSFTLDEISSIYQKFFEMMKESPWTLQLYQSVDEMKEWKFNMTWMGKRLFCIAYYNDPHHRREYKHVQEDLADKNKDSLWDVGAPQWAIVKSLKPRDNAFNDPHDSPFDRHDPSFHRTRLTGLLRGLRAYS
jgi:hypothetical protein